MRRVAFLRGMNVGGHRVTNDELREVFEAVGLEGVAPYQASGNVVFDTPGREGGDEAAADAALEARLEDALETALGYPAPVFVRTLDHLAELVALDPVPPGDTGGLKVHVAFRKEAAGAGEEAALTGLETPDDLFRPRGREILWLRRGGLTDSPVPSGPRDRAFGGEAHTMRGMGTVRRIVAKFGG